MGLDFFQVGLQLRHLRFELALVVGQDHQEFFKLRPGIARAVVHVDQVFGLCQRQPQTFGAQGEFETGAVSAGIHTVSTRRARALGLQQPHVFIKADGAGGEIELAR